MAFVILSNTDIDVNAYRYDSSWTSSSPMGITYKVSSTIGQYSSMLGTYTKINILSGIKQSRNTFLIV